MLAAAIQGAGLLPDDWPARFPWVSAAPWM